MSTMKTTFTILAVAAVARLAVAIPQAPHDAAHFVSCVDCHTPYAGLNDPAKSVGTTQAGSTSTTVVDATKAWLADEWEGGVVTFTSGANLGEFRTIKSNTATSLLWELPLPAALADGDGYQIGKTTYADIETKCKSCHNPAGMASAKWSVGQHQTPGNTIGCGKCHDPHALPDNIGPKALVRKAIRFAAAPGGTLAVTFPSGGANDYVVGAPSYNGVCEVCHTKTKYFRNDGSVDQTHNVGAACTTCHKHHEGFGGAALDSGHMDKNALPFNDWNDAVPPVVPQACGRCHSSPGFRDWIGADGTTPWVLDAPNFPIGTVIDCAACHNPQADALDQIKFVSGLNPTGLTKKTALCGACHQGRESTISVSKKFAAVAETAVTAGTATTLTATATWTVNGWKDYYVLFTLGANTGVYRKISANTANTVTWLTALPAAVTAGEKFVVLNSIATGTKPVDTANTGSFTNSHYLAAAATLFGTEAKVAYEYANATSANTAAKQANVANPPGAPMYSGRNTHGVTMGDCTSCHNKHSLAVEVQKCGKCHFNEEGAPVTTLEELEDGRQFGFNGDIDGDGIEEGIKTEIFGTATGAFPNGLMNVLKATIFKYAATMLVTGTPAVAKPICYNMSKYPYWFNTTNTDGTCDAMPTNFTTFTPRLLKAAFNYNLFMHEPGAWAHNPKYVIQVVFDTIKDLNTGLGANAVTTPSPMKRSFFGHFDATANPFRFRDSGGAMNYPCLRCHGGQKGLEAFLGSTDPLNQAAPEFQNGVAPVMGQECTACHTPAPGDTDMKRLRDISATAVGGVRFPGHWAGGTLGTYTYVKMVESDFADKKDMICTTCHNGRDINKAGLDQYLAGVFNGIQIPGQPYSGTASIIANGANIRVTGLPLYNVVSTNNWLYTTSCQAVGKFLTLSGTTSYNGNWAITACGNGTADLAVPYVADETASWSAFAAGTKNFHDIQGAANVFGSDGKIGYEFDGKTYAAKAQHHGATASCIECHSPIKSKHTMEVAEAANDGACAACHTDPTYTAYRDSARPADYDSDPATVTLADELATYAKRLGVTLHDYTYSRTGRNLCLRLPPVGTGGFYLALAANTTGLCTTADVTPTATAYGSYHDPAMVKAAFNFYMWNNDPGAWAHNFDYVAQLLFDSIESLGGDTTGLTRP